jgi:hypothetical protein
VTRTRKRTKRHPKKRVTHPVIAEDPILKRREYDTTLISNMLLGKWKQRLNHAIGDLLDSDDPDHRIGAANAIRLYAETCVQAKAIEAEERVRMREIDTRTAQFKASQDKGEIDADKLMDELQPRIEKLIGEAMNDLREELLAEIHGEEVGACFRANAG